MRWMRSLLGLFFVSLGGRGAPGLPGHLGDGARRAGRNGHVTDGGSAAVPGREALGREYGAARGLAALPCPRRRRGRLPGRQERCCDGRCGTALECAQLACDPLPQRQPAAEER